MFSAKDERYYCDHCVRNVLFSRNHEDQAGKLDSDSSVNDSEEDLKDSNHLCIKKAVDSESDNELQDSVIKISDKNAEDDHASLKVKSIFASSKSKLASKGSKTLHVTRDIFNGATRAWEKDKKVLDSLVQDLFAGQTACTVVCGD